MTALPLALSRPLSPLHPSLPAHFPRLPPPTPLYSMDERRGRIGAALSDAEQVLRSSARARACTRDAPVMHPLDAMWGACVHVQMVFVRALATALRPACVRVRVRVRVRARTRAGVSTTSSGALRISAQNGGAVVGIDLATGDMSVVQKARAAQASLEHVQSSSNTSKLSIVQTRPNQASFKHV
eukprot:6213141-Pleurochrysis_carterae.AAC.2